MIVEPNRSGSRYGFDDQQTHRSLLQRGFAPYHYDPMTRLLAFREGISGQNTIHVRDSFKLLNREAGA